MDMFKTRGVFFSLKMTFLGLAVFSLLLCPKFLYAMADQQAAKTLEAYWADMQAEKKAQLDALVASKGGVADNEVLAKMREIEQQQAEVKKALWESFKNGDFNGAQVNEAQRADFLKRIEDQLAQAKAKEAEVAAAKAAQEQKQAEIDKLQEQGKITAQEAEELKQKLADLQNQKVSLPDGWDAVNQKLSELQDQRSQAGLLVGDKETELNQANAELARRQQEAQDKGLEQFNQERGQVNALDQKIKDLNNQLRLLDGASDASTKQIRDQLAAAEAEKEKATSEFYGRWNVGEMDDLNTALKNARDEKNNAEQEFNAAEKDFKDKSNQEDWAEKDVSGKEAEYRRQLAEQEKAIKQLEEELQKKQEELDRLNQEQENLGEGEKEARDLENELEGENSDLEALVRQALGDEGWGDNNIAQGDGGWDDEDWGDDWDNNEEPYLDSELTGRSEYIGRTPCGMDVFGSYYETR